MTDYEKEEFWKGLNRLYESSVAIRDATEELRRIVESHERRLDRWEVTTQSILDELRRRREPPAGAA